MNRRRVSLNFAKYYPISIVFDFVLNYRQCNTFTSKQRRAYTRPTPSRDENGKEPGTWQEETGESRKQEHRKGERNGEGTCMESMKAKGGNVN